MSEHTIVGTVQVLRQVASPQLGNQRDILVYLPPSYEQDDRAYPVLYMHDGQNLFDDATSFSCEWGVDETMEAASQGGIEAIVVGIPNMETKRTDEYSPFVDEENGGGQGAAYVAFFLDTLKPLIDQTFRTCTGREHTGILGSSMGGLISLYAFFEEHQTFGFAGVMSPALWFGRERLSALVERAPLPTGRLHLDVGTAEGESTLADTRAVWSALQEKTVPDHTHLSYLEDAGAGHDEAAWGRRLGGVLEFLLTNPL